MRDCEKGEAVVDGVDVNRPPDGFVVRVASQETVYSHHRYDRKRTEVRGQKSVVSDWGPLAREGIVRRRGRGQEAGRGLRDCRNARLCGGAGLRECGRQGAADRRGSGFARGGQGFGVVGPLTPSGRGIEIPLLENQEVPLLKVSGTSLTL